MIPLLPLAPHSHVGIRVTWFIVGGLLTSFPLLVFIAARRLSAFTEDVEEEREADASCANLRVEVAIPKGLADRMWSNIEPRLPR